MEEFEKNVEQPEFVQPSMEENKTDSQSEEAQEIKEASGEAERGVPIGKFKSAKDLLTAYNNLQAEFTRKSQKLAEFEASMTLSLEEKQDSVDSMLQSFLTQNPEAAFYADEIKIRVESEQAQDEKAFENAWAGILYEKLSTPGKAKEPIIQNLIKDDEIQNMVIKNYMMQIQEQKTPIVMSSSSGERVTKTVAQKPDSFEAAKKVVLDLFS